MNDLKTLTILFRTVDSMTEVIKKDIQKTSLNVTEFAVLEALYHKGSMTVQAIIDKVLIANSSMSYVLSNLESKKLIKKERSLADKRSFLISITQEGLKIIKEIYPNHVKTIRERLDVLSELEERTLQTLLKKVGKKSHVKS